MAGIRVVFQYYIICLFFLFFICCVHPVVVSSLALVALAFAAAVGITLLVLGCALPQFNNWWPLFVLLFYCLVPIPTVISRRLSNNGFDGSSSALIELCMFLTTGIVVSAMGLPMVLAHVGTIQWGACGLVMSGNLVVFLTILGYFFVFASDDMDYSMW